MLRIHGTRACCGPPEAFGTGRVLYGEAADQARERLADRCMFELAVRASSRPNAAPQCHCYARDMLKKMSPAEINVVAAGYAGLPLHSGKVMTACATRIAAAQGPHSQRAKNPNAAPATEPSEAPKANQVPANDQAPTAPGESEKPKSE